MEQLKNCLEYAHIENLRIFASKMQWIRIVSIFVHELSPSIPLPFFDSQLKRAVCKNAFIFLSHWTKSPLANIPMIAKPCPILGVLSTAYQLRITFLNL